jgi:N6-adenosine-specific RNA methylase IME4
MIIDPEFRDLLPALTTDERFTLKKAIAADGLRDPLVVWMEQDILVDGHNRLAICKELDVQVRTTARSFNSRGEALIWVVENQSGRRNMEPIDKIALAERMKPVYAAEAKRRQACGQGGVLLKAKLPEANPGDTRDLLAKQCGVSPRTYDAGVKVNATGTPALVQAVRSSAASISAAAEIATLPAMEQDEIVAHGVREIMAKAKEIRCARLDETRKTRMEKIAKISRNNLPLDSVVEKSPLIYADPPWRYEHTMSESRAIENQYPTMALEEIKALPLAKKTTDDAVLLMWATSPKLAEAMSVIESWGFTYRTSMVWVKDKIGMGYYARQRHELLLIATKGSPPTPHPSDRHDSVVTVASTGHSVKPLEFYTIIEDMYPAWRGLWLELFCRCPRDGWVSWGNQAAPDAT